MGQTEKINDGGAAFPRPAADPSWGNGTESFEGMTLRDYFAARVMPMVCESSTGGPTSGADVIDYPDGGDWVREATVAYAMADALLRARCATKPGGLDHDALRDAISDPGTNAAPAAGEKVAADFSRNKVYLEPHEQRRLAAMIDAATAKADAGVNAELVKALQLIVDRRDNHRGVPPVDYSTFGDWAADVASTALSRVTTTV
jgi:hypothetical protein